MPLDVMSLLIVKFYGLRFDPFRPTDLHNNNERTYLKIKLVTIYFVKTRYLFQLGSGQVYSQKAFTQESENAALVQVLWNLNWLNGVGCPLWSQRLSNQIRNLLEQLSSWMMYLCQFITIHETITNANWIHKQNSVPFEIRALRCKWSYLLQKLVNIVFNPLLFLKQMR